MLMLVEVSAVEGSSADDAVVLAFVLGRAEENVANDVGRAELARGRLA